MKATLFLCALAANAFAAQPVLVRITPDTLARLQARDPMIRLVTPDEDEAKVVRPAGQSIIKQSTILHDGKNWTLIPNGAVVFLPTAMKPRVNAKPVGTLLPWTDFLAMNRDWIITSEVTFDQASGKDALPADRTEFWAKQDKVVVAVHQNGPINVRMADKAAIATRK